MRFSQIFLKMGYSTVVMVNKIVSGGFNDNVTYYNAKRIGAFRRTDKVPDKIWSAHVFTFYAENRDELLIVIEGDADERED